MSFEKQDLFGAGRPVRHCMWVAALCAGIAIHSGIDRVRTVHASETHILIAAGKGTFRWFSGTPDQRVQRVKPGEETVVTVEVAPGGSARQVMFVIAPGFMHYGIRLEPPIAEVKDGVARSRVVFNLASGMPLGRHDLEVRVFEKDGRTAVASGAIPFILLPGDMECLC